MCNASNCRFTYDEHTSSSYVKVLRQLRQNAAEAANELRAHVEEKNPTGVVRVCFADCPFCSIIFWNELLRVNKARKVRIACCCMVGDTHGFFILLRLGKVFDVVAHQELPPERT